MVRLFAGGLPRSATTETLRAIFSPDEGMTNCVAIRGRDGRCRGFGFASFANADAAAAAAAVPRTLDGRSVYLLPEKTAVVPAAPPPAAAAEPKKQGPQAGRSLFVRKLPKAMSADAARVALVDAAAPHAGAPPRAHVVRRQGGGGHRGFAFIECATPAEASLVLERLRHTPYGWAAEWVRPKGKKGRSGRGRRGGRRRGRRARQADDGGGGGVTADYAYASDDDVAELYGDDDFESEGDDEAAAPAPAPGLFVQDGGGGDVADGGDGSSDGGGGDDDGGGGDDDDGGVACLRAMAAFVAESEAWAGGVQRFMVERCIDFDDSEEERLEWHTTHLAFRALMEALLEAELARLGVAAEEFAALLADHADSAAASSFLAGVLSMDDYPFFKREMLSLKRDLFAEPNFDALDAHVLAAGPLREPSRVK